ncbi:MAG TPA: hypothetical protein V6D17_21480 [Candidatus Obscuribacterales bacterium]
MEIQKEDFDHLIRAIEQNTKAIYLVASLLDSHERTVAASTKPEICNLPRDEYGRLGAPKSVPPIEHEQLTKRLR